MEFNKNVGTILELEVVFCIILVLKVLDIINGPISKVTGLYRVLLRTGNTENVVFFPGIYTFPLPILVKELWRLTKAYIVYYLGL